MLLTVTTLPYFVLFAALGKRAATYEYIVSYAELH